MVIEKMGWQYKDMLVRDVCNIHGGMIFEEYSKVQHFHGISPFSSQVARLSIATSDTMPIIDGCGCKQKEGAP